MAVHRFLSSPYVSVERIVETLAARTAERCVGRRILAVQDTTEINFTDRDKKRRGFGPAANRTTTGFFIHPVIAVDVESEAVVGLVDAAIWTRPEARAGDQRSRPAEAKELARWLAGCRSAAETLAGAAQLTMGRRGERHLCALRPQAGGARSDRAGRPEPQLGRWYEAVRRSHRRSLPEHQ